VERALAEAVGEEARRRLVDALIDQVDDRRIEVGRGLGREGIGQEHRGAQVHRHVEVE